MVSMGSMGGGGGGDRGVEGGGRVTRPKQPSGPSNFSNISPTPQRLNYRTLTKRPFQKLSEFFSCQSPASGQCIIYY